MALHPSGRTPEGPSAAARGLAQFSFDIADCIPYTSSSEADVRADPGCGIN
jgi:hypothetical protein